MLPSTNGVDLPLPGVFASLLGEGISGDKRECGWGRGKMRDRRTGGQGAAMLKSPVVGAGEGGCGEGLKKRGLPGADRR